MCLFNCQNPGTRFGRSVDIRVGPILRLCWTVMLAVTVYDYDAINLKSVLSLAASWLLTLVTSTAQSGFGAPSMACHGAWTDRTWAPMSPGSSPGITGRGDAGARMISLRDDPTGLRLGTESPAGLGPAASHRGPGHVVACGSTVRRYGTHGTR
eukprot:767180-Hanusia_phi.AAC.1